MLNQHVQGERQAPSSVYIMCRLYPVLNKYLWRGLVASRMERSHVLRLHLALRLADA